MRSPLIAPKSRTSLPCLDLPDTGYRDSLNQQVRGSNPWRLTTRKSTKQLRTSAFPTHCLSIFESVGLSCADDGTRVVDQLPADACAVHAASRAR
jgi:hypothetical protein